ncbi:MAG TPA: response regulator, partial [Bdellovibrionota bacterium]|nr:response regulator [Bdellovibrionota bacterium]
MIQILVVEDDEVTRKLLREVLEKEGYSVQLAASGEEAVRTFRKGRSFPIVISDIRMLELDGMAVLREAKRANRDTAVILMTGFGSMEGAIEAVQEGAFDYVSKPFKISDLKAVVARAAGEVGSGARRSSSRLEVKDRVLIGKSPRIVEVYKTLARAAMSSSTVLIYGESGTGK